MRRLAAGLTAAGWGVHVVAATRAPGRPQYSLLREKGTQDARSVTWIVNNAPYRALASRERDRSMERIIARLTGQLRPDVVHVHHLAYLSSGLRFHVPTVGTLHDHWPWCPAGGTLLRWGREPCSGPRPGTCPACHAAWMRPSGVMEELALSVAGRLASLVDPRHLHGFYRRIPARWRQSMSRRRPTPATVAQFRGRQAALRDAWNHFDVLTAPSRYLAETAGRHGLGEVRVIPHGIDATGAPHRGRGAFVFLGSVLPHKGAHVVVQAYRSAFPRGGPGLIIHGPVEGDPVYAAGLNWPTAGLLPPERVPSVLADARALVMGSIWPENAPLVIYEARAAGCPVIAPEIGGIPEFIRHGQDGLLYPVGDVQALARCLKTLDPVGLQVSPPPTLRQHVDAYQAVYEELMHP